MAGLDNCFGGAVVIYESREELHELVDHFRRSCCAVGDVTR